VTPWLPISTAIRFAEFQPWLAVPVAGRAYWRPVLIPNTPPVASVPSANECTSMHRCAPSPSNGISERTAVNRPCRTMTNGLLPSLSRTGVMSATVRVPSGS
jgi:hypothetical protein